MEQTLVTIREGTRVIVINMLETIMKKWVTCMIRWVISAKRNWKKQVKRLEMKSKWQKRKSCNRIIRGRNQGKEKGGIKGCKDRPVQITQIEAKRQKPSVYVLEEGQEHQIHSLWKDVFTYLESRVERVDRAGGIFNVWQQWRALPSEWQTPSHTFKNFRELQERWTQRKQMNKYIPRHGTANSWKQETRRDPH